MGTLGRMGRLIAFGMLVACSKSTPEPATQPTLEAVVVELKDVPPPEVTKPPEPRPITTVDPAVEPKQEPVVKVAKVKTKLHAAHTATAKQPETKQAQPDTKPDPTPAKPDTKPPLETNPYIYK